ncbi:hypothetical protein [Marinoscillum sp.]|uniref:hypothetical protein n=1 Tax=Marinoscillum sp. TaxID=2024838 RepID=UPI003BAC40AF
MRILKIYRGAPNKQLRELLNENIIGTPGESLVYQQLMVNPKLDHIKEPVFLTVELGGSVVGACCLVGRTTINTGRNTPCHYIRYFTFRKRFRSQPNPMMRLEKKSVLKDEITEVLSGGVLDTPDNHLFYAYVDPENIRSSRLISSFGFEEVGRFRTVFFSRFFPKRHAKIESIQEREWDSVQAVLRKAYKQHCLFTTENIGFQGGYLGYYENGELIAGLQANSEAWKVHEIPGGKLLLGLISKIPLIRRLFSKNFRFLSIEGIFYPEGRQKLIETLLEDALARSGRNTAIICLDPKSDLYGQFKQLDQGLIRILSSEKEMAVVAKGANLEELKGHPVYVSGFDNM